jgi:hypothetical protein
LPGGSAAVRGDPADIMMNQSVIKNFLHKGIERFFLSGSKAGLDGEDAAVLVDYQDYY